MSTTTEGGGVRGVKTLELALREDRWGSHSGVFFSPGRRFRAAIWRWASPAGRHAAARPNNPLNSYGSGALAVSIFACGAVAWRACRLLFSDAEELARARCSGARISGQVRRARRRGRGWVESLEPWLRGPVV